MKHAILLAVHTDPEHVLRIIDSMEPSGDARFDFYIHIDTKSDIPVDFAGSRRNVFVYKEYKVNWGGFTILKAYLFLAGKAMGNGSYDYYHWGSGQDWIVYSPNEFDNFFKGNAGKSFVQGDPMPNPGWEGGGYYRYWWYAPYENYDARTRHGRKWIGRFIKFQKKIGFRRPMPKIQMYYGFMFCSLSHEAMKYLVVHNKKNPAFLRRFKYTFGPEEVYHQTLLFNAPELRNKIVNRQLWYIDWTSDLPGNQPKKLREEDYQKIMDSGCVFMRKVDRDSERLIEMIGKEKLRREVKAGELC